MKSISKSAKFALSLMACSAFCLHVAVRSQEVQTKQITDTLKTINCQLDSLKIQLMKVKAKRDSIRATR